MSKTELYGFTAICLTSPFWATLLALTIGKKLNLFEISKRYPLYIMLLGIAFYGSFFFGEYFIPLLNTYIYDIDAKVMGPIGFAQDYCIPLAFVVPVYLLLNKMFDVRSSTNAKIILNLLIFYSINFIAFYLTSKPFEHPVY